MRCRAVALLMALAVLSSAPFARPELAGMEPQPPTTRPQLPSMPAPPLSRAESLPELLQRVLRHDPQVRAAQAAAEIATERRLQVRSRLGPSVGVNVTQGQASELEFGVPVDRRTDRAEAVLRWNLYNSGNDGAEWRATELEERAAKHELRRAQEDVAQRLAEVYLDALRLQEVLLHSADRLSAVRQLAQQVARQRDAGKLADTDVQQARASLLDAEMQQQELVADHQSARQRLAAMSGDGEDLALLPLPPLQLLPPKAEAAASPAAGLVAAARDRALAAKERVRPEMSVLAPRIDLELQKRLSERTTPANTTEQRQRWMLTARWEFPVGGELQSRRREAEVRAEAAQAEADRLTRAVKAEQVAIVPKLEQAGRAEAQLTEQVALYDDLVRAGEIQYAAGRRSLAQLMQLRDSRYNAQQRRVEQKTKSLRARVSYLALGGGLLEAVGVARALPEGVDEASDPRWWAR
jgi:outer membrane protein TolC